MFMLISELLNMTTVTQGHDSVSSGNGYPVWIDIYVGEYVYVWEFLCLVTLFIV
jgi:hypothetical protein